MKKIVLIVIAFMAVHTVNAQNVYIPDPEFKAWLVGNYYINTTLDSEITVEEAQSWSGSIKIDGLPNIEDITGIEAFVNITNLELKNLDITTVNLTGMTKLIGLNLDGSKKVRTLDLSPCENLLSFRATGCAIEDLDLSVTPNLQLAHVRFNVLNTLKLPNKNLTVLQIDGGNFTTDLNLSGHTNLVLLQVSNVDVSYINLKNGNNTKIKNPNMKLQSLAANICVEVDDTLYAKQWSNVDASVALKLECASSSASIKEVANAVKVYPNPANNKLTIADLQGLAEVSIHNLLGKEVLQTNATQNIDISTLPQGVYTLKIKQNGTISQAKFIKK